DRVNAEWALAEVTRELRERLAAADSAAMREREADIADVAREIAAHLSGGGRPAPSDLPRGSILVADELSPVDAARLDPRAGGAALARLDHRPLVRAAGGRRNLGSLRARLARARDRRRRRRRSRRPGAVAGATPPEPRAGPRGARARAPSAWTRRARGGDPGR